LDRQVLAQSAIITVPDEQLPGNWFLARHDMPYENLHRETAIYLGLPDVAAVTVRLARIYLNSFATDGNGSTCVVFPFCCGNAVAAQHIEKIRVTLNPASPDLSALPARTPRSRN
jgi:hypothetical protein